MYLLNDVITIIYIYLIITITIKIFLCNIMINI